MPRQYALFRGIMWVRRMNWIFGRCYPNVGFPLGRWIRDFFKQYGNEVEVTVKCEEWGCLIMVTEQLNKNGLNESAIGELEKVLEEVYRDGDAGC